MCAAIFAVASSAGLDKATLEEKLANRRAVGRSCLRANMVLEIEPDRRTKEMKLEKDGQKRLLLWAANITKGKERALGR